MKSKAKSKIKILITLGILFAFSTFNFNVGNCDDSNLDNKNLKISSSITITSPDNSSSWLTGATEWIYYDTSFDVFHVNITLYKDGIFELCMEDHCISTPNTGAQLWEIPLDLEDSDQYQLKNRRSIT